MPDFGDFDAGDGLLLTLVALAVIVILIPILFFGAELAEVPQAHHRGIHRPGQGARAV
jgi:hypothetical protein